MSEIETPRPGLPPDALSLPASYYTEPDRYRAELDRFFLGRWVHAGREEELAAAGQFVLRDVAGESVIVTRDEAGALHAFYNVCRHRGTRLCDAEQGAFRELIRCPYHAWAYDLAGRLVAAPQMDELPHFRCDDYPLVPVAVAAWEGHLLLHLGDQPTSLEGQFAALADKFRPWGMGELRRGWRTVYDVAANWKLILQNYSECLHCPGVHPALQRLSHFLSGENEPPNDGYLGGRMSLRDGIETLTLDGRRSRPCLPGLSPRERRLVAYYAVLPNLLLSLHPDYMMTHTIWPRAVDRTEIVCEWHFHPEALAAADFSPEDAVSFWDLTNRQDWHVCEQMQLGLRSRGYRPGPYSNREDLLYAFDRMIREGERQK